MGCLSLAVELNKNTGNFQSKSDLLTFIKEKLDYLVTSRPTAVNMQLAAEACINLTSKLLEDDTIETGSGVSLIIQHLEAMLVKDVDDNVSIGDYGAKDILSKKQNGKVRILTHCNTGSLATAGYGTALGVVRSLHKADRLDHVYCTETRPYNQGSRLTAFELVYEKMPATLICDSMASAACRQFKIDAIIVGADRVAANGDTVII